MRIWKTKFDPKSGISEKELPRELDSPDTLVLFFYASRREPDPEIFQRISAALPTSCFMGCSTDGVIHQDRVEVDLCSLSVIRFDRSRIRVVSRAVEERGRGFEAGADLAKKLHSDDLRCVFILSDGLEINGTKLLQGFTSILSKEVVITGGIAADGTRSGKTWVLHQGRPITGYVQALGIYGDKLTIHHGCEGGWNIFGPERLVSRSEGNIIYELDGRPALDLYREYLGEHAQDLAFAAGRFPLAIRLDRKQERRVVRSMLAMDEKQKAVICGGDVPQGSYAQLMMANIDRVIEGAACAASQASISGLRPRPDEQILCISVSCYARKLVLGDRTEEEVEAVLGILPPQTEQVGFYSFGEIAPRAQGDVCDLHNQTMTLTVIQEI